MSRGRVTSSLKNIGMTFTFTPLINAFWEAAYVMDDQRRRHQYHSYTHTHTLEKKKNMFKKKNNLPIMILHFFGDMFVLGAVTM